MRKLILLIIIIAVLGLGLSCASTVVPQSSSTEPKDKPYYSAEEVASLVWTRLHPQFTSKGDVLADDYLFYPDTKVAVYKGNHIWEFKISGVLYKHIIFSSDKSRYRLGENAIVLTATYYERTGVVGEIKIE